MKPLKKFEKKDFLVTLILILLAILFSLGIYSTYQRKSLAISGDSVGKVRYKYHIVMRKYADRMVWEEIESDTPVFLYDAVLTKDKSDAEIVLKNGMHIMLEPNSLVIIEPTEKEIGIKLEEGSVYSTGSMQKSIILIEDNTELQVENAKVRIIKQKEKVFLETEEGNVYLKGDKYNLKLKAGEALEIQKGGNTEKRKLIIMKQYPAEGEIIRTEKAKAKVRFRWEKPLDSEQTLHLSQNPQMENSQKIAVKDKTEHEMELPTGKYFWQLRSTEKQGKIQSFRIAPKSSLRLISPLSDAQIFSQNEITFKWEKGDESETVYLEISQDEDFKKLEFLKATSQTNLTVSLPEGTYFWRVRTKELTSEPRRFQINTTNKESDLAKSKVESVKIEKVLIEKFFQKDNTVFFSWKPQKEAENYRIKLSQDPTFSKKTRSFKTEKTKFELELNEGTWYWQVEALSRKKTIAQSAVKSFSIKSSPLKPPVITEVRVD